PGVRIPRNRAMGGRTSRVAPWRRISGLRRASAALDSESAEHTEPTEAADPTEAAEASIRDDVLLARHALQRTRYAHRDCRRVSPAVGEKSALSVCQRYQDATDRYGFHTSPIFVIRFESGRLRNP